MFFRRFYDDQLAQASYLVGCQATSQALVVDPNRDVEPYLRAAAAEHLRITHVTETHIHADFVSGARELARRAEARLLLSDEGGDGWRYGYAAEDGATLLCDGDRFQVGHVEVAALHTPGHTPEHMMFLVTDTAAASEPMGALTGDFVFVGDVGRPDLLERAARVAGTMEAGARQLFRSLQRLASLPDYLARESTKIDMVLPELNVRTTDVYFTYPEELRHSKRIAVFRDFLLRKVAETRF